MKLKDLTEHTGIQELITATGGQNSFYNTPARALGVQHVAYNAINSNPNLAHTNVRILPNLQNAFYNFDKNEIILGQIEPIGLAHEIEHAKNIQQEGLYRKVLRAAQGITRVNNVAALPVTLALRTFIQDKAHRDDIFKTLAAFSAAAAAPVLLEELQASLQAAKQNQNGGMEAWKTLGPALLAHTIRNLSPSLTYQTGRKL